MNRQDKMEVILMVSSMLAGPRDPVNDDETQAHGHQQEANRSETKGQDFRGGSCRLLVSGHDSEVEDGREDEDEARSRCGTNDPKYAQDVGGEDNQQIDARKQASGNEHVPQPAELLVLKQHLLDSTSYREQNNRNCKCDRYQHGHSHTQDQHIKRVHLAVGVQQLRLHPVCGRQGGWSAGQGAVDPDTVGSGTQTHLHSCRTQSGIAHLVSA